MTVRKGRCRLAATALAFSSTSSSIDRVVRMRPAPGLNRIVRHHGIIDNDVKASTGWAGIRALPLLSPVGGRTLASRLGGADRGRGHAGAVIEPSRHLLPKNALQAGLAESAPPHPQGAGPFG